MSHLSNLEGHVMEGKLPVARLATQPFKVVSPYEPAGDQPKAIEQLARNIESGMRYETLLGVTGSGKTYTMAKTIEAVQKPTLVLAPNKTLAGAVGCRAEGILSQQCRGVLRELLRLLSARSVCAYHGYLYRKGCLY